MYRTRIVAMTLIGLFVFAVSAAVAASVGLTTGDAPVAQPRATIQARATQAAANLQTSANQAQAAVTSAVETVQAGAGQARAVATNAVLTAQAVATEIEQGAENIRLTATAIAVTVQAAATEINQGVVNAQATAQALATTVNQGIVNAEATVTAIAAEIQTWLDALPESIQDLLPYLSQLGSVAYDSENNRLIVTALATEEQSNLLIDIVVEASGYDPNSVNLAYTSDGLVVITLTAISDDLPGTLTLGYRLTIVNGRIVPVLEDVAYNGGVLSTDQVPPELLDALQVGINASAQQAAVNWPGAPFVYTVALVQVTDTTLTIIYHIPLDQF